MKIKNKVIGTLLILASPLGIPFLAIYYIQFTTFECVLLFAYYIIWVSTFAFSNTVQTIIKQLFTPHQRWNKQTHPPYRSLHF